MFRVDIAPKIECPVGLKIGQKPFGGHPIFKHKPLRIAYLEVEAIIAKIHEILNALTGLGYEFARILEAEIRHGGRHALQHVEF